ncbi:hypothetical protein DAEQUDRAFT_748370 [Daedalea quercina L-15889]|uniref:Sjogrens syndrome scleroderma autoantigen 1 family protein n=1 Tax=Daedalea quercina L-15889 TaxID=1314783 RepID=A0A165U642_9APHY|nr:hypothetical protein DAEQUDRAFT_748370 [Daedalea quercina L-15889]
MSTVIDVSGKLGEYMLKGWVLTDKICSNCSKVPLMRSPSGPTVYFCANCDAVPPTAAASSSRSGLDGSRLTPPTHAYSVLLDEKSSVSSASSMTPSRTSTPPTEVSQAPSSPTFAPPVDMGEVMRRRQQSDTASAEIGRRMLKGWAMLADECPNSECYGIPLVRPPKPGGEKDPRKECVICGAVYVDEDGAFGSHLVPLQPSPPPNVGAERSTLLPPPPLAPAPQPIPAPRLEMPPSTSTVQLDKGKSTQRQATLAPLASVPSALGSYSAVQESIRSLEFALHALSERVKLLSSSAVLEPTLIAQTADAMAKVAQALVQVRRLE